MEGKPARGFAYLVALLFFPLALLLMAPLLVGMVAWFYVGGLVTAIGQVVGAMMGRKPRLQTVPPPHFAAKPVERRRLAG